MRHPLLDLVSNWKGRHATEAMLEAEGFALHRLWQKYLLDLCGSENEATLNKYWDEYAAEVVSSAATINPSNRAFAPQETYRSAYLDELAAAAIFAEGRDRNRPFPRCLYEYRQKIFTDRKFYERETRTFESLKESEIQMFVNSANCIIEKKRDIIPYIAEFSRLRGFVRQGRTRFVKTIDTTLQLEIFVDTGGSRELGRSLPLHFIISCSKDIEFVFRLTTFDVIIPGFSKYEHFDLIRAACSVFVHA